MSSNQKLIPIEDLHYIEQERILEILDFIKGEYSWGDSDILRVESIFTANKTYEHTIKLAKNPKWFFRWEIAYDGKTFFVTSQPNPYEDTPCKFEYGKVPDITFTDLIISEIEDFHSAVQKKEQIQKRIMERFFGDKAFHDEIDEKDFNSEEFAEFDRDFTLEERKEIRQLLFAWNEGVQMDSELSDEVKETAERVHDMAQIELKKSKSVKEFMIRAGRTVKALKDKFYMKPFFKYIEDSGFRITVNTAISIGISGYATGGLVGMGAALLAYGTNKFLETEKDDSK